MLYDCQISTHVLMTSNRMKHLVTMALIFASVSLFFNKSRRHRKSYNAEYLEGFAKGICASSGSRMVHAS